MLNNLRITGFQIEGSKTQFLRQVGANCAQLFLDYALIHRYAQEPERWPLRDQTSADVLEAIQSSGKGAIFVTAHFANWEVVRLAAQRHGVEMGMIYRAFNNPYVDEYAFELASVAGRPVFRKGGQGMRDMLKHVRSGGKVLILVDQRSGGAPRLDFMGQPAETATTAADLALKFDVPLIPCYAERVGAKTQFTISIEQPVDPSDSKTMMQMVNNRIEDWIRSAPEQWFWLHNRWKVRSNR